MKYMLLIPDELWRKFKSKLALKGISIRTWINEAIRQWVEEEEEK